MKHILVIGNGLAGMTAAIRAAELGCNVTVVSKAEPARSQSVMAGGGINAALNTKGENDSIFEHAEDTIKAGVYLADEKAVEEMTANAPSIVEGLAKRGVVFDRDVDGNINLRYFGGQKKMKTKAKTAVLTLTIFKRPFPSLIRPNVIAIRGTLTALCAQTESASRHSVM